MHTLTVLLCIIVTCCIEIDAQVTATAFGLWITGGREPSVLNETLLDSPIQDIAAGMFNAFILTESGTCYYIGQSPYAVNGAEITKPYLPREDSFVPQNTQVHEFINSKIVQIGAGSGYVVYLTEDNRVFLTGNFPPFPSTAIETPLEINTAALQGEHISTIVSGVGHTLLVTATGKLYGFGLNSHYQLGRAAAIMQQTAIHIPIPGGERVIDVSAGGYHTMVLTELNRVYTFGDRTYGALGRVGPQETPTRVILPNDKVPIAIAAGGWHSLILASDGTVYGFGRGIEFQLQVQQPRNYFPFQLDFNTTFGSTTVKRIAAGFTHSVLVTDDGAVWTFGGGCSSYVIGRLGCAWEALPTSIVYDNIEEIMSGGFGTILLSRGEIHTNYTWPEFPCEKPPGRCKLVPDIEEVLTTGENSILSSEVITEAAQMWIYISIAVLGGLLMCALVVITALLFRRKMKKKDKELEDPIMISISQPPSPEKSKQAVPIMENDYRAQYSSLVPNVPFEPVSKAPHSPKSDKKRLDWEIDYSEITVQEKLGQGGFGIVYCGVWRQQKVAVKQVNTLLPGSDEEEAFAREVEVMKNLKPHTNVAVFLGMCRDPLCIVMEYLPGGNVKTLLNSPQKITMVEILQMSRDTAAGMFHLHEEKIVHRDLACRNLLLTETGRVKISDFGLSRFATEETNTTQSGIGPLRWMAPEALMHKVYSSKSDVWSFGCVLIEMITRQDPFPDLNPMQAALEVSQGRKPSIPDSVECTSDMKALIFSCLETDPSDRPTFAEIGDALQNM